jgi:hypothetical protein
MSSGDFFIALNASSRDQARSELVHIRHELFDEAATGRLVRAP